MDSITVSKQPLYSAHTQTDCLKTLLCSRNFFILVLSSIFLNWKPCSPKLTERPRFFASSTRYSSRNSANAPSLLISSSYFPHSEMVPSEKPTMEKEFEKNTKKRIKKIKPFITIIWSQYFK